MTVCDRGAQTARCGLVAAEWIKLRSLRSTWAVLGFGALVVIGFAISASALREFGLLDPAIEADVLAG